LKEDAKEKSTANEMSAKVRNPK